MTKLGFGYFLKIDASGVGLLYRTIIYGPQQQHFVIIVINIFLAKYGLELNGLWISVGFLRLVKYSFQIFELRNYTFWDYKVRVIFLSARIRSEYLHSGHLRSVEIRFTYFIFRKKNCLWHYGKLFFFRIFTVCTITF